MRASIKRRLVGNFLLVIIVTVLILEVFLVNGIKNYYYKGIEEVLSNQINISVDFFSRYFSFLDIEDIIIEDIDLFWKQTNAQVQILDLEGNILMDSIGTRNNNMPINTSDVKSALEGKEGRWIGNVSYDSSPVMAISYPLTLEGENIGVLRFISSLRSTNYIIYKIVKILLIVGIAVIIIAGLIALFLANTIIHPLEEVTSAAEKMAAGHLTIRSKKKFDDEIGKLSDTLNYMAGELIRKEKLKTDFITSISHELRTPLTSIKGWAITLKSDELRDRELMEDGLNIIEEESDRLSVMVEELLDFSKFVSGEINLSKEEVDMKKLIMQIGRQFQLRAKEKNINFQLEGDMENLFIILDENRIKQVLINLLDNAFKFTQDNGEIIVKIEEVFKNIIIRVKDNGLGICKEDLPYIKEKFYKGKNSKSNSGLGLSISDEIIKLHNGKMEIRSELKRGTEVIVSLPAERNDIQ